MIGMNFSYLFRRYHQNVIYLPMPAVAQAVKSLPNHCYRIKTSFWTVCAGTMNIGPDIKQLR